MRDTLKPGIEHELRFRVPQSKTVPALYPESPEFREMPEVFATGFMVGFLEWACIAAVKPHLDWPEEQTVGTHVNVSHTAATPPGLEVTAKVKLTTVEGRRLVFEVEARDDVDVISRGTHERFVINRAKFSEKVRQKAKAGNRGLEGEPSPDGAMTSEKKAVTDSPIHGLLAERWSPYAFDGRPVAEADLRSLFEAARWAPSSYNEQPWRYIVATRDDPEQFQRLLSCLVEGNQVWAKAVPVLALGVVSLRFARNARDNRAAVHDLGLAAGNLVLEATARGLFVHQMIGILPDKAREIYGIPEGFEAWTAIAIGYRGDPASLPDRLRERDLAARERKPLSEFVFSGKWGNAAALGRTR